MKMQKIKVAIMGYGNVGKFATEAVLAADDMELVGVVSSKTEKPVELTKIKMVKNIEELGKVDVALLCGPTRSIEENAIKLLEMGINTVDSYDIHKTIYNLKATLDKSAKKGNAVAIVSAGWDPGSDSILRALFLAMVPFGVTYTNFGPGMSMGHSVVAKSKKGVKDAMSVTLPAGEGIHRRQVFLVMEPGANFEEACKEIKADSYFINDDTKFVQIDDLREVMDRGHGVNMTRKGISGQTQNQLLTFDMRINNPALTSQVMVSCARATTKLQPGAYTTIEVPVIKMLPGNEEDLIRKLV